MEIICDIQSELTKYLTRILIFAFLLVIIAGIQKYEYYRFKNEKISKEQYLDTQKWLIASTAGIGFTLIGWWLGL